MNRDLILARAEKLVSAGKLEAAVREYERLLDGSPADVVTLNRIGDLEVRLGRVQSAVAVFRKIAVHYSAEGFHLKAIAILKKVNRIVPSDLSVYSSLADLYARQGLIVEARAQYAVVADSYLRRSAPDQALEALRKSFELADDDTVVGTRVAVLLAETGKADESEETYRRLLQNAIGACASAEIIRIVQSAMAFHPQPMRIVHWAGESLILRKQLPVAIAIVSEAVLKPEADAQTLALLGRAYVASGDIDKARAIVEKGLRLFPEDASLRRNAAGLALLSADEGPEAAVRPSAPPEGAAEAGEQTVVEQVDALDDRLQEADVYASYGLTVPALWAIEQVLAACPEYPPAMERHWLLVLAEGRRQDAVSIAADLLSILERDGLRDEGARVQDELRRRGILEEVLGIAAVPELLPDPDRAASGPVQGPVPEPDFELVIDLDDSVAAGVPEGDEVQLAQLDAGVPEEPAEADDLAVEGNEGDEALSRKVESVQRLIARRKITRATKLLDELLLEHPDEPELMRVRDGLESRKSSRSRKRTSPGETLASALQDDDLRNLDVN